MTVNEAMNQLLELTHNPSDTSNVANAMCTELIYEHPTNQATFIRVLAEMLEQYSNQPSDLRNVAAVKYAENAVAANIDNPIPFI